MSPSRCSASSMIRDPNSFGYAQGKNYPRDLSTAEGVEGDKPYLHIVEGQTPIVAREYEGWLLRLGNPTEERVSFSAIDSGIGIIQQALDTDGQGKDIEYIVTSWCGNSYHQVYLEPNQCWELPVIRYTGPQETQIRFKLEWGGDAICSKPYAGGIHPEQFTVKCSMCRTLSSDTD